MYFEEVLPELRKGAKIRRKSWFETNGYMYYNNGELMDEKDKPMDCCAYFLKCDDWEIYKEEFDWKYIKNSKCLCYFWDNEEDEKQIGYLTTVNCNRFYLKIPDHGFKTYSHCRPIKEGEINFYKDKEDKE